MSRGNGPWGGWGGTWSAATSGTSGPGGMPGPPPWLSGLLGAPPGRGHRPPRARRGDVRSAILDVLAAESMNGYQVIQQIAERTSGAWKPSPGSVYPTVQQLEDEGLVEGYDDGGRRRLRLTDDGREYVAQHADELADTWRPFTEDTVAPGAGGRADLKPVIGQVMAAVWQVMSTGTPHQQAQVAEILGDTRRRIYGLLADGDPES
jgi:DNA-binding PadR family transcriptional regulator